MKAVRIFTWPNGSCYMWCWSKDSCKNSNQILNGTFYPAHNSNKSKGNGNEGALKGYFSRKLSFALMTVGEKNVNVVICSGAKENFLKV